jgi:next-to-BRCA1 protein 1
MGHVDSTNPAGISELVSSSESTVCYEPLAPGAEFPFTVLLRTPPRTGKTISYWRLTTKGGIKFGDRLWCDVNVFDKEEEEKKVEKPAVTVTVREVSAEEPEPEATKAAKTAEEKPVYTSQMIFPKLEKESPGASVHGVWDEAEQEEQHEEASAASEEAEEFEEWADDDSDSGFMTDEEYDILDASDEEFLSPPRK